MDAGPERSRLTKLNLAPVAKGILVSGLIKVGQTLTATYVYDDYEGDKQSSSGTLFQWYRADDLNGANETAIAGATGLTYVLAVADVTKYLRLGITPGAVSGTTPGATMYSAYTQGPIVTNLAPEATNIVITGAPKVGASLSSSYSYSDYENDVESGSTRQWYIADDAMGANESAIAGATGANYVCGSGDAGRYLRVAITPRSATGNSPGLTVYSAYAGPVVTNLAPEAQTVAITGSLGLGQVLSSAYTYFDAEGDVESGTVRQWYRADNGSGSNAAPIAGATGPTYTLTATDMNKYLQVGITPASATGNSPGATAFSAWAGPVAVNQAPEARSVAISGTAVIGEVLSSAYTYFDAESDPEVGTTRQWYRADNASGGNEVPIGGATGATYTITSADQGKYLRVSITPASSAGTSPGTPVYAAYAGPVPGNQSPEARSVTIGGTAAVGQTLTGSYAYFDADNDVQSGTTLQWYRADNNSGLNEAAIPGATAATYTLTAADGTKYLRLGVTPQAATGASPGATAYSGYAGPVLTNQAPVASNVAIAGYIDVGSKLRAIYTYTDAESNPESGTTFQWYRANDASGTNLTAISGATTAIYALTATDVGKYIRVAITPKSNAGTTTGTTVNTGYKGQIITSTCGGTNTVAFTYRGSTVTYGTLRSPTSGVCFLDRNLGASRAATSSNDGSAYGHYFQWGRNDDGHQLSSSATTTTLATSDEPGHSNFILPNSAPYDWLSGNSNNRWATTPRGPCPAGWHVPTEGEWAAETGITNLATAYSQLRLTTQGLRSRVNSNVVNAGIFGQYWASTVNGSDANYFIYRDTYAVLSKTSRSNGVAVRCIRDE